MKQVLDLNNQFENRQEFILLAGVILGKVARCLTVEHEDPKAKWLLQLVEVEQLKSFLLPFTAVNIEDLVNINLDGFRPFRNIQAQNILREPDQEWMDSMLDFSTEIVSCDCPCEVALSGGRIWLRWTIPDEQTFKDTYSTNKMIYTAMVIAEELLHLGQKISLNETQIISLESTIEVHDRKAVLKGADKEMRTIRESDVTEMMYRALGEFPDLQWFRDRSQAPDEDIYQQLSLEKMVRIGMDICEQYGFPDEFLAEVVHEVSYLQSSKSNLLANIANDPVFAAMRQEYEI